MLEPAEIRQLIDAADVPFRPMILLGVNCGFGNHDCGQLPLPALNLESGWIEYPRPKTGIPRRCPLWPETIQAIREALAQRPESAAFAGAGLALLQSNGRPWVRETEKNRTDNVSPHFRDLMRKVGLYRAGLGFYTLRHVFRTVADAAKDPVAIDLIMGHSDSSMASHYRERVDDARLQAVAEHVHTWLFGTEPEGGQADPDGATLNLTPSIRPQRKRVITDLYCVFLPGRIILMGRRTVQQPYGRPVRRRKPFAALPAGRPFLRKEWCEVRMKLCHITWLPYGADTADDFHRGKVYPEDSLSPAKYKDVQRQPVGETPDFRSTNYVQQNTGFLRWVDRVFL